MPTLPEEGGAGGQYDLVRLYLVGLAGQGHVEKVPIVPEVLEGVADVSLEVVPFEAEFLLFRHLYLITKFFIATQKRWQFCSGVY